MLKPKKTLSGRSRISKNIWKHPTVLAGIIGAIALIVVALVSNLGSQAPTLSKTADVTFKDIHGSFNYSTVNVPVHIGDVINPDNSKFVQPTAEVTRALKDSLRSLKDRFNTLQITVEVETGSGARRQVAEALESVLKETETGKFWRAVSVGVAPSSPITIFYSSNDFELGSAVKAAIAPYVSGQIALSEDKRRQPGSIRLYLNGVPAFSTSGSVTFDL